MAAITWVQTPTIKELTLPSGNTYWIKDDEVRQWIGDGTTSGAEKRLSDAESEIAKLSNATHWLGVTTTALTDGSTTNPIVINGETVTAVSGDIVQDSNGNEYIFNGTAWQALGSSVGTLRAFAYADTGDVTITPKGTNASSAVTFSGGTTDDVLGENTTFTNSTSSVSFAAHTTAEVLTSDVTATVPKTSSTKKYLTASASGTAVSVATSDTAITDLGTASTDTFVKSYPGATSNLVTTSVPNVTSAGTAASWSATVTNEVLTFAWTANTPATLGTAITAATGAVDAAGTGAEVMTGLGTATTAAAVTGYNSPTTDTFAQTVSITAQPSVTLTAEDTTSTGAVDIITAVSTSGTDNVTFTTTGHTADAITSLGAGTAAAQTITVGSNDTVTAVTGIGTGTAAGQTFTGTQETYTVTPTASS